MLFRSSDALKPELGENALGRALLIVTMIGSVWSALHFWLAARTIERDFGRLN